MKQILTARAERRRYKTFMEQLLPCGFAAILTGIIVCLIYRIIKAKGKTVPKRIGLSLEDEQISTNDPVYILHAVNGLHPIPVDKILYIQAASKPQVLVLHAETAIIEYDGKISEAEALLGNDFWRIHQDYLINSKKVRRIIPEENLLELTNGETCPLSRKKKTIVPSGLKGYVQSVPCGKSVDNNSGKEVFVMTKKTTLTISSIALAVAAITCFYAVWNGMNMIPPLGIFLCNIAIYICNLITSKNAKKD